VRTAAPGPATKAEILVEALPYIRAHHGRIVVVKIGGEALDEVRLQNVVAEDLALMALVGIELVVVHGGGPQVSEAMRRSGVEPTFVGGLRVTDDAAMEVVREVLVGSINSNLVGSLCSAGLHAVGISGIDGGVLVAERVRDLGRVGDVRVVRPDLVLTLLGDGYTPVVASVAPEDDGTPLNVNADAAAGALAAALGAAKLVYLTNVEGLYSDLGDRGSLISELKASDLEKMVPNLSAGMGPKARSAVRALGTGVGKVHILDGRVEHSLLLEVFTDEGVGTQVLP
jgi:acetylglutamate kinase